MDIETEEFLANVERTAQDILLRKHSPGVFSQDTAKALSAFIMSAEPDFFDGYETALIHHVERILAVVEQGGLDLKEAAKEVSELVDIGRRKDWDALLWIEKPQASRP